MDGASEIARRLIAEASNPDRLYPLRGHDGYGFYAGRLPDGDRAIVFWDDPGSIAILRFRPDGDYLGAEVRAIPPLPELPGREDLRARAVDDHLRAAIGLEPGLVKVRRFFESRWKVGIRPVDDIHEEFAADPAAFSEGDADDIALQLEYLASWVDDRQFVFDFNNNYWVDDGGEVVSS